jgi:hypothetical protein
MFLDLVDGAHAKSAEATASRCPLGRPTKGAQNVRLVSERTRITSWVDVMTAAWARAETVGA